MNVPIEFLKIRDNAQLPVYATEGAAACDVFISDIEVYGPGKVMVYLGFATDIPPGWQARIQPRSSFAFRGWVMTNSPAIIDSDYRGEWILKFQAIPETVSVGNPRLITESMSGQYVAGHDGVAQLMALDPGSPPALVYPGFPYSIGERAAQVVFEPVNRALFIPVEQLTETVRGQGGFGSTGQGELQIN
jgi:dUTP pyrophosphatase